MSLGVAAALAASPAAGAAALLELSRRLIVCAGSGGGSSFPPGAAFKLEMQSNPRINRELVDRKEKLFIKIPLIC